MSSRDTGSLRHVVDFSPEGRALLADLAYGKKRLSNGFRQGEIVWELDGVQVIDPTPCSELANHGFLDFPAIRQPKMQEIHLTQAGYRIAAIIRQGRA